MELMSSIEKTILLSKGDFSLAILIISSNGCLLILGSNCTIQK